jgi:hypothetical protein
MEFHVVSDQDMTCDAILGADAMTALRQKYGEETVSARRAHHQQKEAAQEALQAYEEATRNDRQ